ncbi:hypothetical protein [Ferroacidibacillus organovorans]|uniref:Uncharacterized protein n=1 Tax=Ferroacidibacillus organovorans TaxID=1765683 RepID=A0A101XSN9_9BACL|nr:hypothetical protein [Ferroacidibacillus organovorans]KUO96834.1 hypothetical protein ATW55_08480 [Ferroacidibacillus organovorans]
MSRIRIVPTVSALILTFALLFGGFQIYRTYDLVQPLKSQLTHIASVQSASIDLTGSAPVIVIKLGLVSDLQTTYDQLQSIVSSSIGTPYQIVLKDHRTATLYRDYETLQPILYQGLAHGMYTTMIANLQASAAKLHVQARITMNASDVFLQFQQGSSYLYAIVPYSTKFSGASGL